LAVWPLYAGSYAKIGLIVPTPRAMRREYDQWWIHRTNGTLDAFRVGKTTHFGVKMGLSGSNGSPEGRAAAKAAIATFVNVPGNYSEVSHRPEEIAHQANVPAVCAVDAQRILDKAVQFEEDGLHYTRVIAGVGPVTKVLIGRPRGVPARPIQTVHCAPPAGLQGLGALRHRVDTNLASLIEHAGMMGWR
jgi:hypothetical protein